MDKILSQKLLLRKFTRAVTKKMCVQELWFLHSACWPMLVNIYMKTHENIFNILKVKIGHDLVTKNATFKVLHSASRLTVLNICVKFHKTILNSFNVIEGQDLVTETAIYKVQRGVTKKIHMQELWFLHSARHPIKLNIRMKFHEDILNAFQVRERTRFCDGGAFQNNVSPS